MSSAWRRPSSFLHLPPIILAPHSGGSGAFTWANIVSRSCRSPQHASGDKEAAQDGAQCQDHLPKVDESRLKVVHRCRPLLRIAVGFTLARCHNIPNPVEKVAQEGTERLATDAPRALVLGKLRWGNEVKDDNRWNYGGL